MSDNPIVALFEALMDDEIGKNIVRLIDQDLEEDKIIEALLEMNIGR